MTGGKTTLEPILHLHFLSDPESVADVLQRVMTALQGFNLSDDDQSTSELLLAEVINNIIEHAYREATGEPIEFVLANQNGQIRCSFIDRGDAMPDERIPDGKAHDLMCSTDELPEGGFGWNLIRNLSRDIDYVRQDGKNLLTLTLDIDAPSAVH